LYEESEVIKLIITESRILAMGGSGGRRKEDLLLIGYRVLVLQDEIIMKIHSTTLRIYSTLLNCAKFF
jgi:hypothetical protein